MHIRLLTPTGEPLTHADVCLTLERRSEPRPRGGRVGGAHEHRDGMRRDRGELRATISEDDTQMKPEHRRAHRGVEGEVPEVMPRRKRETAGERGVEQAVQSGRAENEHAKDAAEDREIEVEA